MEPIAYLNGNFLPQSQVRLGINDAGFVWGATVTDLVRTFRHQLFRLDAHLIRFRNSAKLARVPLDADDDQLAFIAQELVRHNAKLIEPTQDLCLCMFATPGPIGYYLGQPGGPGDGPPTLCMHTFPVPFGRYARLIRLGGRLVTWRVAQGVSAVPPIIKHRSRLHWWIAEKKLYQTDPDANLLLLDTHMNVTETPTANFLLVHDGQVCSPSSEEGNPFEGLLRGISLTVLQELCEELGVVFREVNLRRGDLMFDYPDEAMLCSTPYCLAPVSSINGKAIPWPGPVFQQLIAAWNRKVGLDIWGQICSQADRTPAP